MLLRRVDLGLLRFMRLISISGGVAGEGLLRNQTSCRELQVSERKLYVVGRQKNESFMQGRNRDLANSF